MNIISAIAFRIFGLTQERDWSTYQLSYNSGVPTSTLSNLSLGKCKSCNLLTLLNVCRGLGISLAEFFSDPVFDLVNINDD